MHGDMDVLVVLVGAIVGAPNPTLLGGEYLAVGDDVVDAAVAFGAEDLGELVAIEAGRIVGDVEGADDARGIGVVVGLARFARR
jgi:hypothetical protein